MYIFIQQGHIEFSKSDTKDISNVPKYSILIIINNMINYINYKMYSFRPSFWFVNTAFQQSWNPQHSNIYDVCLPYYVAPLEDTDIIS